jgi:hypothetical protein
MFDLRKLLGLATPHEAPMQHPQHQQQGYTPNQQAQMTPIGHPIPQNMMDSFSPQTRQLAQIYQSNPMDSRVLHLDPKMFGYKPDNAAVPAPHFSAQQMGGMQPQYGMGSNFATPIQGIQNAGLTPLQGSVNMPNPQSSNKRLPRISF